jgi:hypothetical protein
MFKRDGFTTFEIFRYQVDRRYFKEKAGLSLDFKPAFSLICRFQKGYSGGRSDETKVSVDELPVGIVAPYNPTGAPVV